MQEWISSLLARPSPTSMTLKCEMIIWISGIIAHTLQTRQEEKVKFTVQLCDPVAHLVLILRYKYEITSLSGFMLKIQNIFVLFNSSSIIEVMLKNIKDYSLTHKLIV